MKKMVMLVDDDSIFSWVSAKMIEKVDPGLIVSTYLNGKIALDFLQENYTIENLYYIFLDINMPELNGWEFLEALEKIEDIKNENIFIHVISSSTDTSDIKKAESYNLVHGFISKPLSPDIIKKILEQ